EAIAEYRRQADLSGDNAGFLIDGAMVYALWGKTVEAEKMLQEAQGLSKNQYVSSFGIAAIYALLGKKDQAFEWLEKVYEEKSTVMEFLKVDPNLKTLHSDPRFADLVRRVGLP